jgi:hypothetical protein
VSHGRERSWWFPLATLGGAAALRFLGRTWTLRRTNTAEYDRRLAGGERCIYALWHCRMLPLIYAYRGLGAAALVSQSRDGELIAGVIERIGYVAARGSSSHGGQQGFNELVRFAAEGRSLTITPDGPRGPREVVKPGLVRLASLTGLPVLPVASASRGSWVLRSWDGFRVPRPFAVVWISYGELVRVPPGLDEGGIENWRRTLEDALRTNTARLAGEAGEDA